MIDKKDDSEIGKNIRLMLELANILKKNRMKNGSLDFDLAEIKFSFGPLGILNDIKPKPRLASHNLIEEFMLMANKLVTEYIIEESKEQKIPFIYRIHDKPDRKKIEEYVKLLKIVGIKTPTFKRPTPKSFQKILEQVANKPEERLIGEATLRTMMKAEYSPKNIGHFGLAFKKYTHFTSPIRRYPDLVVHRILKLCLKGQEKSMILNMKMKIKDICRHSSDMEKRAIEAEREAVKVKQLQYMKNRLGDEFYGIISGVRPYGIFVEIEDILAEGLVHIRNMDDDYYNYDEDSLSLYGLYTGKSYRLGDRINVQVVNVNLEDKQLDLILL